MTGATTVWAKTQTGRSRSSSKIDDEPRADVCDRWDEGWKERPSGVESSRPANGVWWRLCR